MLSKRGGIERFIQRVFSYIYSALDYKTYFTINEFNVSKIICCISESFDTNIEYQLIQKWPYIKLWKLQIYLILERY